MANLKGFIKDYQGNIILPISRGELIFDKDGKIAFHSSDFKALKTIGTVGDPTYVEGRYGLMSPDDLANIEEAQLKIAAILAEIGGDGSGGDSIKDTLESLQTQINNILAGIGTKYDTDDKTVYGYINAVKDSIGTQGDEGTSTVYGYINTKVNDALTSALEYKGTICASKTGSATITGGEFPNNSRNGDVYKAVEYGTYKWTTKDTPSIVKTISAKEGDSFIYVSDTDEWTLVPSGDEISLSVKNTANSAEIPFISGVVSLEASDGINITVGAGQKITISGNAEATGGQILGLADRVTTLESDVSGLKDKDANLELRLSAAETTIGDSTSGLVKDVNDLQVRTTDTVKTWDEIRAKDTSTDPAKLINGNKLVEASAVYDVTELLVTHLEYASQTYLSAETKYYEESFDDMPSRLAFTPKPTQST